MRHLGLYASSLLLTVALSFPAVAQTRSTAPGQQEVFIQIRKHAAKEAIAVLEKDPAQLKVKDIFDREPLGAAVEAGLKDVVDYCVKQGSNVNREDRNGDTPIGKASADGRTEIVAALVQKKPDLNVFLPRLGGTPLYRAAYNGHTEVVRILLDNGADVNAVPANGMTALFGAVARQHRDTALLLLQRGASPNVRNEMGASVIASAYFWKDPEVIAALKKAGASLSIDEAIILKEREVFDQLLRDNPGLAKSVGPRGGTALMTAAAVGDTQSAQALLDKGADPNVKSAAGVTALALAMERGDKAMVDLLNRHGAKAAGSPELSIALCQAAAIKGKGAIVEELLAKGADVNAVGSRDETALYKACYHGAPDCARVLLDHNADPQRGAKRETPLIGAATQGHADIIRMLAAKGVDVKANSSYALHVAARNNRIEAVKTLIELGCDVNARTSGAYLPVPLLATVRYSPGVIEPAYAEIARILLQAGADPLAKDARGRTAIDLAFSHGDPNVAFAFLDTPVPAGTPPHDIGELLAIAAKAGAEETVKKMLAERRKDLTPAALNGALRAAIVGGGIVGGNQIVSSSSHLIGLMFIDNGADVNSADSDGNTALHLAVKAGRIVSAQALLSKGADLNARNKAGKTPLDLAVGARMKAALTNGAAAPQPAAAPRTP